MNFKLDTSLVERFIGNLGEIIEPIYNTVVTPPALPPRPISQWFGARIRGKIHSHGIMFLYFEYVNHYLLTMQSKNKCD